MSNEATNKNLLAIDVNDLQVGMYVNALDRPWLETQFLFQGFRIRSDEEIAQIRSECEYVFVDADESVDAIDFTRFQALKKKPPANDSQGALGIPPVKPNEDVTTKSVYSDVGDFKSQVSTALQEYDAATSRLKELMQRLSSGERFDLGVAQDVARPLVDSVARNPSAICWLARMQSSSDTLYRRSVGTSIWATVLATHLNFSRALVEKLSVASLLLDVGKIRLPDRVLEKRGVLTTLERELVEKHVGLGIKVLEESSDVDPVILEIVATHHERHDGSGYPKKLKGLEIPVLGRIAGLADFYDAVTSRRAYADAWSSYDALRELNRQSGIAFQSELVAQFIQSIGFFPPGTLVELNDESVGAVIAQNRCHRLKPEIVLILDPDKNALDDFEIIDLQTDPTSRYSQAVLHIDRGLTHGAYGIDPAEYFL